MWQILRSFPSSFSVSQFSVSQSFCPSTTCASQFQIDFSGRQQQQQRQLIDLMSPPFFLWAYDCVIRLSHIDHATGWLNTIYSFIHTHTCTDIERLPHKSLKRVGGNKVHRSQCNCSTCKVDVEVLLGVMTGSVLVSCGDFYFKSSRL